MKSVYFSEANSRHVPQMTRAEVIVSLHCGASSGVSRATGIPDPGRLGPHEKVDQAAGARRSCVMGGVQEAVKQARPIEAAASVTGPHLIPRAPCAALGEGP